MSPGSEHEGFQVCSATPVGEIFAVVYKFLHLASGARVIHIHNADEENAFTINFPTPPPDDTGMPHILEHMVLAGSRKYPVREPFFEMVKMSMATFINAMTGYDCTYYPVCSNVPRDLFNLADVYLDAVFHPCLAPATFKREACHLAPSDLRDPASPPRLDGVVYSEMKGAFSDPMACLHRLAVRDLLPDTCYGFESGGDPEAIPGLTEEKLRQFHAAHYNPANARVVLYGNIEPGDYLRFLNGKLGATAPAGAPDLPSRQAPWGKPRLRRDRYPIGSGESPRDKTFLALNWRVGEADDPRALALWHIIALVLLGNEGAPLRRAIINSGLGDDLVLSGSSRAGSEATFHVGLQGSEPERLDRFRKLVLDLLSELSSAPLEQAAVAAAFQQAAYDYQEIVPLYPLYLSLRAVDAWIYGNDPVPFLAMAPHLESLRRTCREEPMFLSRQIRRSLVDNQHRLDIVLEPDHLWQEQYEARLASRLEEILSGLDQGQRQRIAAEAIELEELNGRPNSPQEVASLPQLKISDLPEKPVEIPFTEEQLAGSSTLLVNHVFSNGIVYLELAFDLTGLPFSLWACLPRYIEAIDKMGTAEMDYAAVAARVSSCTGGIEAGVHLSTRADNPDSLVPCLTLSMKTLDTNLEQALDILHDLLFALEPRDRSRAREVALQARTHYRNDLIQEGQVTVRRHAARGINPAGGLAESIFGQPQLAICERWVDNFADGFEEVAGGIGAIRDFLLNRCRVNASVTASPASVRIVQKFLSGWLAKMREDIPVAAATGFRSFASPPREGLAAPLRIAHCAMVMPAPHLSSPREPLLAVGCHLVQLDYMMSEIRFKGNAYGAGFGHHAASSLLSMSSFRDPQLVRTLEVFGGVIDFVHNVAWSRDDLERAIIGVAKVDCRPIRPGAATGLSLRRYLSGISAGIRAERRRVLLKADPAGVRRALLETLEENLPRAALCVMAGRRMLEQANATGGFVPLDISDLRQSSS